MCFQIFKSGRTGTRRRREQAPAELIESPYSSLHAPEQEAAQRPRCIVVPAHFRQQLITDNANHVARISKQHLIRRDFRIVVFHFAVSVASRDVRLPAFFRREAYCSFFFHFVCSPFALLIFRLQRYDKILDPQKRTPRRQHPNAQPVTL